MRSRLCRTTPVTFHNHSVFVVYISAVDLKSRSSMFVRECGSFFSSRWFLLSDSEMFPLLTFCCSLASLSTAELVHGWFQTLQHHPPPDPPAGELVLPSPFFKHVIQPCVKSILTKRTKQSRCRSSKYTP